MNNEMNTRILVIDDEEVVRDSIREALIPRRVDTSKLDRAASSLFEDDETEVLTRGSQSSEVGLTIDFHEADGGAKGLEIIERAVAMKRPFALVFLDMRMPGWDGLETAKRIRAIDRGVEIVFVTAYSDHGLDQIVAQTGLNVGYHCKPFDPSEIRMLALRGIFDWNRLHNLESLIESMGRLRSGRSEIETLLQNVLEQVSDWVSARSVLIARRLPDGRLSPLLGCGALGEPSRAERLVALWREQGFPDGAIDFEGLTLRGVSEAGIIAVWEASGRINVERIYLLRLFIEHASQIVQNSELQERLLLGEKLAAIGQAVGAVAHDIRSPIGAILTAVDVSRTGLDQAELVSEMLDVIERSAESALETVGEILDYTRKASVDARDFLASSLFQGLQTLVKSHSQAGRPDIAVTLECPPGLMLHGDKKKLERVVTNLVVNAREALETSANPTPAIAIKARQIADTIQITISDNGPGIPAGLQETLFEPFVTHGKANGNGLGLAIVRQIVEAHRGAVACESTNHGTRFTISLPRDGDRSRPPPDSPNQTLATGGSVA